MSILNNLINGISLGSVYALIALGYTMVYGIAKMLNGRGEKSAFDRGVSSVSMLLVRLMLVMAPAVFAINAATKGNVIDALLFATSVAVGITPQMLPVIVTTSLSQGAKDLARRQVIVKELPAIQNLGAMDVLCCDKTGTLTRGTFEVTVIHPQQLSEQELLELAALAEGMDHVRLRGLMAIPPISPEPGANRPFFAAMRQLFVDIKGKMAHNQDDMDCLSMGMSGDYADAIAEGSTLVRVGTALFGPRPPMTRQ